jgi:hypothetical protein
MSGQKVRRRSNNSSGQGASIIGTLGPIHTEKNKRIKSKLTNKSSRKDDLNRNRPITFLNSRLINSSSLFGVLPMTSHLFFYRISEGDK